MFISRNGAGPRTFLGLHGWSGDHNTFRPLTRSLPEDVSFFSADLPGCGQSPAPRHWTLGSVADEIAEAAWRLPEPVTLVGNCSGALLGLEAASRLGRRLERLVLIDPFAVFPWYFRIFLAPVFGKYAYYTTFANPVGRLLTNFSLRAKRSQSTTLTGGFTRVDHQVTYRYLQLFESFPKPDWFTGITQPVDLVYGENTFQAVKDSIPQWQTVWPQARAWKLAGAGHLPIQEATAEFRRILFEGGSVPGGCPLSSTSIAN